MHSLEESFAFLERIYGKFDSKHGFTAAVLGACEKRVGTLPAALREVYRRTGKHKQLHQSFNRLAKPNQITWRQDVLVFYEEHQGGVVWGVRRKNIGKEDPPVVQGVFTDSTLEFYPEFPSVTNFVWQMGSWQAVMGGLRYTAAADVLPGRLPNWERKRAKGMDVRVSPEGVVLVATPGVPALWAGAKTRTQLTELARDYDIEWAE